MLWRNLIRFLFPLILLIVIYCASTVYWISYGLEIPMVIHVPDDYPTIQEAVNAAKSNAIILVAGGVYHENVVINKPLSLIGEYGNSTIKSDTLSHVIKVTANNVNIVGFNVEGASPPFAGIYVKGLYCNITGNRLVNNYRGIYIYDSSGLVLRNNEMKNNTYNFAIWGRESGHFRHDIDKSNIVNGKPIYYMVKGSNGDVPIGAGFVGLVDCFNVTVRNLTLAGNEEGILIAFSSNCVVENVTFSSNNRGILLVSSHNNLITGNNFSGNVWSGVSLYDSRNNVFKRNVFLKENIGIFMSGLSDENNIIENLFSNCNYGIWIQSSSKNRIIGNRIARSVHKGLVFEYTVNCSVISNHIIESQKYGFWLYNSANNTIYHNNFINNVIQAHISDISEDKNSWNFNYPLGGNFWSDYLGKDENLDGIGDTPYIIGKGAVDNFPLIAPVSTFKAYVFKDVTYYVNIICNSTISGFCFNPEKAFISFNLTRTDSATFCRVVIPDDLLWTVNEPWAVYVDDQLVCYTIMRDENYTYLSFVCFDGAQSVRIEGTCVVREFSYWEVMLVILSTIVLDITLNGRLSKCF
ncbi:MAG: NosD domain-containing protein [Nitrososphaeria archaeon]